MRFIRQDKFQTRRIKNLHNLAKSPFCFNMRSKLCQNKSFIIWLIFLIKTIFKVLDTFFLKSDAIIKFRFIFSPTRWNYQISKWFFKLNWSQTLNISQNHSNQISIHEWITKQIWNSIVYLIIHSDKFNITKSFSLNCYTIIRIHELW